MFPTGFLPFLHFRFWCPCRHFQEHHLFCDHLIFDFHSRFIAKVTVVAIIVFGSNLRMQFVNKSPMNSYVSIAFARDDVPFRLLAILALSFLISVSVFSGTASFLWSSKFWFSFRIYTQSHRCRNHCFWNKSTNPTCVQISDDFVRFYCVRAGWCSPPASHRAWFFFVCFSAATFLITLYLVRRLQKFSFPYKGVYAKSHLLLCIHCFVFWKPMRIFSNSIIIIF